MVFCVLWCSVVQTLLLPMLLCACDRYRADIKAVWEKCVAVMSNDDADDENSRDGGIHADLIYERPYDYNYGGDIMVMDRITKYEFSALERGIPQIFPLRDMQEEKMHYLQVPPTRRYSHDETEIWTTGHIPAFLHGWGSAEDMAGVSFFSLPRHERRRSSGQSYHEEGIPHRKRRKSSESVISLKQFAMEELYKDDYKCFSREEIVSFIDESPHPSPRKSSRRSSSVSIIPDTFPHQTITLAHFPLTDFEREPQALRRFSNQGKSCTLTVPATIRSQEEDKHFYTEGLKGIHMSEKHDKPTVDELAVVSEFSEQGQHRTALNPAWGDQESGQHENKGSTNSFLSSPASSGYITFHSDSIGSAS